MAKGCMAVSWGHILDDTKLSVSRGLVSKLNNRHQKFMFYDILCKSSLRSMKQILEIKRQFRLVFSQSPCF